MGFVHFTYLNFATLPRGEARAITFFITCVSWTTSAKNDADLRECVTIHRQTMFDTNDACNHVLTKIAIAVIGRLISFVQCLWANVHDVCLEAPSGLRASLVVMFRPGWAQCKYTRDEVDAPLLAIIIVASSKFAS